MNTDPFRVLGLGRDASAHDVRAARRDLAREHHPDAGGDADTMRRVNVAAAEALKILSEPDGRDSFDRSSPDAPADAAATTDPAPTDPGTADWVGSTRDIPSFTVEALPVEAFEALLIAAAELGEIADDEPPYVLRTLLADPIACWCQLDVVPDAGASTVSVTIAAVEGQPLPAIVDVRNAWITALNRLDWSSL